MKVINFFKIKNLLLKNYKMKNEVKQLSPLKHTLIGALAGSLEVTLMQPTIAFKNALQSNRHIPTNPFILYRGTFTNILSIAPITATQFGTYRLVQKLTENHYYLNNQFLCSSKFKLKT